MPSFRVPNFIDFYGLTNEDCYHLFEVYYVSAPEKIKSSGRYFQRVWMPSKRDLLQLLDYMGYSIWWEQILRSSEDYLGNEKKDQLMHR